MIGRFHPSLPLNAPSSPGLFNRHGTILCRPLLNYCVMNYDPFSLHFPLILKRLIEAPP